MRRYTAGFAAMLLAVGLLATDAFRATADHQPADKVGVSASTVEILGSGAPTTSVVLTASLRASAPADLILALTAECALWTSVVNVGASDVSESLARVTMWVEIDGDPVPVSPSAGDDGKIVFCDRLHRQTTANLDDDDRIEQFMRTRSANAFNWTALNLGAGIHTIEVLATLEASGEAGSMPDAIFQAGVGRRTLTAQPARLSTHASF